MKRLAGLGFGVLLLASPASADDTTFVRLGLGVGRVRARTNRAPSFEPSVVDSFAYWGHALELTIGGRIGRWAIGGTVLEHTVELDRDFKATTPLTGEFTLSLFSIGPSVEFHRDARGGPWCGGMLAVSQFSGFGERVPFGVATSVQGGWDFAATEHSSFGLGARVTYARLAADDLGRQDLFSPMLVLSWIRR